MRIDDWLWLASGAVVTALMIVALAYWIVQEARERRTEAAPPPSS